MATSALSKEFVELVKGIGEVKSKQEEDRIILAEMELLKVRMAGRNVTPTKMREYLLRMIYVEMLGHDASFGHINAVKMTHGTRLNAKRVGYLTVSVCLHPEHELMLLLVNTLQHDLRSSNHLEVSMALIVVTQLISKDLMLALIPLVVKALDHTHLSVRKKAIVALHRCYQINREPVLPHMGKVHRILCDKDPSVMGASLPFFLEIAGVDPASIKELVPSFVSILKQIIEHRLPRDYDYRRMPAPWIQLNLLKLLAKLGEGDRANSEGAYEVLHEVLRRADIGINIGYALIYECVRTIATIYPNNVLLEEAAKCVSRFITSEYHNRKYLGIDALASIVQVNPLYAAEHQLVVIDCLDDPDETLRRKTLDLLFRMTNTQNAEVIVENMLRFLRTTTDTFLRRDLVSRITQLAERYSPNNSWYIETLNSVFEIGGELVRPEVAHSVMRLIAEGSEDEDEHNIQQYAVDTYVRLLDKGNSLPDIMLHLIAWVLGEFGHLSQLASPEDIISQLCGLLDGHFEDETTRCWILSSMLKLVALLPSIPPNVLQCVDKCQRSMNVELQQLAHEFFELCTAPTTISKVLPRNCFTDEVIIDPSLPFLDDYVEAAQANGARVYNSPDENDEHDDMNSSLNFKPYMDPTTSMDAGPGLSSGLSGLSTAAPVAQSPTGRPGAPGHPRETLVDNGVLRLSGVQKKWGPSGYSSVDGRRSTAPPPQAHSTPTSPSDRSRTDQPRPEQQSAIARDTSAPKATFQSEAQSQMTEKEKRAAMLFSGLSGSSSPLKPVSHRATSHPQQTPLRSRSRSNSPTRSAANIDPAPADDSDLLLDLSQVFGGSSTESAPASNPTISSVDYLLDLDSTSACAEDPSAHDPGRNESPQDEVRLASMLELGVAIESKASESASRAQGLNETRPCLELIAPELRSRLESLPNSSEASICFDAFLRINSITVYPPSQPIVIFFLHNQSDSALWNVQFTVRTPVGLTIGFDCEPRANIQGSSVTIPSLTPNAVSAVMISVLPSSLTTAISPLQLTATCAYADQVSGGVKEISPSIALSVKDFLRPAVMQTAEFGANWQLPAFTAGEHKWRARTGIQTPAEAMDRLAGENIYGVQNIGQENIASAQVSHSGGITHVLIHLRLSNGVIDFIVRSPDANLSSAVSLHLQVALQ